MEPLGDAAERQILITLSFVKVGRQPELSLSDQTIQQGLLLMDAYCAICPNICKDLLLIIATVTLYMASKISQSSGFEG
jgi:hypothetical protein